MEYVCLDRDLDRVVTPPGHGVGVEGIVALRFLVDFEQLNLLRLRLLTLPFILRFLHCLGTLLIHFGFSVVQGFVVLSASISQRLRRLVFQFAFARAAGSN